MASKLKNFLIGTIIAALSAIGAKKANAQGIEDWDPYGVTRMDQTERNERLAQIEKKLDTIDFIIADRERRNKAVHELIPAKFPMEKYSKMDWNSPTGLYIIDDIDSKIQAQLEQGVDTAVESKLKKDMALLESFFNKPSLESLNKLTGMTIAKLVEFYSNNLRRLVRDGDFTEQEAEVISSYLDPYSTINKVPIKSRYEMLVEIIKKQQFKDYTSLMAQRLNEEITVAEYNKEIEHYKEIYDLLLKTLELTNKNKGLKDASSVWGGFSAISWQATESVRRANAKKTSLTEERAAIYNPPTPPVPVQEKSKKSKGTQR